MKKLLVLSMVSLFLLTGCERESSLNVTENNTTQEANLTLAKERLNALIKEGKLVPKFGSALAKTAPGASNARAGVQSSIWSKTADYTYYQSLVQRAINPDDYECGPTELDGYIPSLIVGWTSSDFFLYNNFGDFAFLEAYFLDNTDGGDSFGTTGQFTNVTNRVFKDLKRFWNIPTDIQIADAHGTVYNNVPLVVTLVKTFFTYNGGPVPDDIALDLALTLQAVFGSPKFHYFNNPLLTFNAFASTAEPAYGLPKKIVMGDGIQQAYADLGYSDVATQAILAHEYGHHVQFAQNVDFGNSPEGTRRTELMADALSAYFLTHKRGAALNWKRVQEFLGVFYSIGDCAFDNDGHHGTPNQRMKAAEFGYQLANQAQKQGHILTSEAFIALFDAELPVLIAPDAD
ncbi:neutral zinc metallopeptidase [Runella salmonicolor]|uniref:Neutral zinc metallopeptidase n=1 Tax=Runella salmonicolor TaxID=2950278 RepID=A0ABT1FIQ8_9BACT|nr:neutral zinc metallopeptidase [Runella salmonicolor]MCP1381634.1 neutral zinc metallopeptidase [Runella salmonicolor]